MFKKRKGKVVVSHDDEDEGEEGLIIEMPVAVSKPQEADTSIEEELNSLDIVIKKPARRNSMQRKLQERRLAQMTQNLNIEEQKEAMEVDPAAIPEPAVVKELLDRKQRTKDLGALRQSKTEDVTDVVDADSDDGNAVLIDDAVAQELESDDAAYEVDMDDALADKRLALGKEAEDAQQRQVREEIETAIEEAQQDVEEMSDGDEWEKTQLGQANAKTNATRVTFRRVPSIAEHLQKLREKVKDANEVHVAQKKMLENYREKELRLKQEEEKINARIRETLSMI